MVVTTGELLRPTLGPTRTEADFASHIEQTVATDPEGNWVFVVDNLNIHCSAGLVGLVAETCEMPTALGKKGRRGVLQSVAAGKRSCRSRAPDSLRVSAEAQFVAEPGRNGVRRDHAEGDPAWLVYLRGGFAHEAVEFHRLFQSRIRQAVPLDLHGSSAVKGSRVRLGKRAKQGDVSYFIGSQLRKVGLVARWFRRR